MPNTIDLNAFYTDAAHPDEAIAMMEADAVVPLGTTLWPA